MKKMIVVLLIVSLVGCTTLTTIQTDPSGAKLYINDEPKGTTPYVGELSNFVFNTYNIRIELDGYFPLYVRLQKEAKAGPIVGGFFLFIPWLWVAGPRPAYYFPLAKKSAGVE